MFFKSFFRHFLRLNPCFCDGIHLKIILFTLLLHRFEETMAKNLLIVESPAKAKTIEKILGSDFEVKSCYGHIRDLEKNEMGIDIKKGFKPR